MFSNNRKVSNRQLRRMIMLNFLGVAALLLPTELAKIAGKDGILSIIIGGLAAILFSAFLCNRLNQFPEGILETLKSKKGTPFLYITLPFYIVHFLIVAAFLVNLLAEVVQDMFLLDSSRKVIMLISLLFCTYGMKKGIESRGRICEIVIYIVVLPLLLMILLAGVDVNLNYLAPLATTGYGQVLLGAYYVFSIFSSISVLVLMGNSINNRTTIRREVMRGIEVVVVLTLCIYGIALGFFQEGAMKTQRWPGITLISVLNTPGGFLQRYDAFLIAAFLISVLIGLSSCIFYGGFLLQELVDRKNSLLRNLFTLGVFLAGLWFKDYNHGYNGFMFYIWYVGTPLMIILPILFRKRRKKNA